MQGSPMANLLTWDHATVTICHSRTQDLKGEVCLIYLPITSVPKEDIHGGLAQSF